MIEWVMSISHEEDYISYFNENVSISWDGGDISLLS